MKYIITYDIGTTSMKTCLYEVTSSIQLVCSDSAHYSLTILKNGGAEQDAGEWWKAMCRTTKNVLSESKISGKQILAISFCSQMQGLVLVDKNGNVLRKPMSYIDQRASLEYKQGIGKGIKISGLNAKKLLTNLRVNGGAPTSVKDPLWKYKWVENNEKDVYNQIYKWLDVKEFFVMKCTNQFVMTEDTAFSTFLMDTSTIPYQWSKRLIKMYQVDANHLPKIIKSTDLVGTLTEKAASELGLSTSTKVFGGGGDANLIGLGAGCSKVGDTHIYSGTSGWVGTVVDQQVTDPFKMIASIVSAQPNRFHYFAEMETAGKCFEWVMNHLALDEIGIYLEKKNITEGYERLYTSLYDYLSETVKYAKPGSNGVIFTPWLHGNRCPFEDPSSAGMFFNLKLTTGKTEMIRSVLEGICYHLRWMLESQDHKINTSNHVRFVGGGALSDTTAQILSDITGRVIEVIEDPQNAGAVGAAAVIAVGLGWIQDFESLSQWITAKKTFYPDINNVKVYDTQYSVFKRLYQSNKKNFDILNKNMV